MSNENRLTYIDENGNEILCEILFTFDSEEFNKSYVLFYPIGSGEESADGEEDQIEVMAASYTQEEGATGELHPITTEEEWELIESVLHSYENEEEEEEHECCGGHHHGHHHHGEEGCCGKHHDDEEHECECDHDDEDDEDEHECCCKHDEEK